MSKYKGIPDTLTLEFVKKWVQPRVSEKRFSHIIGVAKAAKRIAEKAGVDPYLAELAGWLHDASKEVKDKQLLALAEELGLKTDEIEKKNGHLIHGPVGALICKRDLGLEHEDVLLAIGQHTLGSASMTELSKVVFLADCLEEGRSKSFTDPIWKALDLDEKVNLDKAMLVACDLSLHQLIEKGKTIHPRTIECRNHFLAFEHKSKQ